MSSSESSDDEEAKKIHQAVIPDELMASFCSFSSATNSDPSEVNNNGDDLNIPLKSNRTDKTNEDDEDSRHTLYLKTTPEFKRYVQKHLTELLDRELKTHILDGVWNKKLKKLNGSCEGTGIKLFSGDRKLCFGESVRIEEPVVPRSPPRIRPKKHRLKNSSESSESEEEKITSCVFTVDDIFHENRMLEDLAKAGVQQVPSKGDKSSVTTGAIADGQKEPSSEDQKKKKKKKLKKLKTNNSPEQEPLCDDDERVPPPIGKKINTGSQEVTTTKHKKKKKRES